MLNTNSSVMAFVCGVLVGVGCGFLIAMWFQTSILLKFKEEIIDWFEQEDEAQGDYVGGVTGLTSGTFTVTRDMEERLKPIEFELGTELPVMGIRDWREDPKATRNWDLTEGM